MTSPSPSLTLRIKKQDRQRSRRDFLELVDYLDEQSWRAFAILLGERYAWRARVLAWLLVLTCTGALACAALRGCA